MTYQTKAPKKVYFKAGFEAGFKCCANEDGHGGWHTEYRRLQDKYGYYMEDVPVQVPDEDGYTDEDIDRAWKDYCEYWKNKAMNSEE